MIPEKYKKYAISCLNPHEYNHCDSSYVGVGMYTGDYDHCMQEDSPFRDVDDYVTYYEFVIPTQYKSAWFHEKEIFAEVK